MRWILLAAVFVAGMLQPIQAGMNAEFRRHAAHPLQAALLNMFVGFAVVLCVVLVGRIGLPSWSTLNSAPWWSMMGGFLGATLVLTMLMAAPVLGAALLIACFVAGQLVSSITLDQHALVGYELRRFTPGRVLGVLLLFAGVLLIERSA